VFQGVVGACVEQPLTDFWLFAAAHGTMFSRNEWYVYCLLHDGGPNEEVEMRAVFVHGACVQDGPWWWHRTAAVLQSRGVSSAAPALPSCGETGVPAGMGGPGLDDDVAAVRGELQRSDEPTVVVAHSYGGIVVAEAAVGIGTVRHLLLISSYLPEVGESLSTFGGREPASFLDVDMEAGTIGVRAEMLAGTFMPDCPELVDGAMRRLARQSLSVTQQPVRAAAWQQAPTTYLVCRQDRGTPTDRQHAFARRAQTVVELDAAHHPFLAAPQAVADIVLGISGLNGTGGT
jgi:pimeloyl-ACP methyl ester carboxylesterase